MASLIGIDPGGAHTGVACVSLGDGATWGQVLHRDEGQHIAEYAREVAQWVSDEVTNGGVTLVGIEGLTNVRPYIDGERSVINPHHTVEAGVVLGACFGVLTERRAAQVVIVPPGNHGQRPLRSYPASLIGPREQKGTGVMRHARSAYDVALASRMQAKIAEAR